MKQIILTLTLISGLIAEGLSGVSYFRYATGDYNNSEESGFYLDRDKFLHGLGESHWTLAQIEKGDYFRKFLERQK